MFRSNLDTCIKVTTKQNEAIKKFLENKSSNKSHEQIFKENKKRLSLIWDL